MRFTQFSRSKMMRLVDIRINPILEKITKHEFLQKLSLGILEQEAFKIYLQQDYLYLNTYSNALLFLSDLAVSDDDHFFLKECVAACATEPPFKIRENMEIHKVQQTNAGVQYARFINQHIQKGYQPGLAAVFPCFYVYFLVAKKMYPENKTNAYCHWFDTYQSKLFVAQTQKIISILERVYEESNESQKNDLLNIISQGAQHEYHFWDDCYVDFQNTLPKENCLCGI